jgi:cell division protein FtsA
MSQDFVAVVDLGTTKAVCMAASSEGDKIQVKALASTHSKALRKGVLTDYEEAAKALDVVIRRVEQDLGEAIVSVVVSISGGHIEGTRAQGLKMIMPRSRQITNQDVMEVIKHSRSIMLPAEREQIQAVPLEFKVDGQEHVRQPIGMNGSRLEVTTFIVSGSLEGIQKLEKAVAMTGHRIEQLVLSQLAAGIGILKPAEMESGATVVDIGGSLTEIAVFGHGSLVDIASFPVGSEHVTNDISQLLRTSVLEAERLKIDHGSAMAGGISDDDTVDVLQEANDHARPMQRKVLCEIIEARMREIVRLTKDYLKVVPARLVLTGGGAQLSQSEKLFQEAFPGATISIAEPKLGGKFGSEPGLATVAGLARFALQCKDEVMPATGSQSWRDRVRSIFTK